MPIVLPQAEFTVEVTGEEPIVVPVVIQPFPVGCYCLTLKVTFRPCNVCLYERRRHAQA